MKHLLALYWPLIEDEEILRMGDRLPCQAEVIQLQGQEADLRVTDHFGGVHIRLSIPVGKQPGPDHCILI